MPLRKNRGVLIKDGRLKPGLQRRGPLGKNRAALAKRNSRRESTRRSAAHAPAGGPKSEMMPLRKNRGVLIQDGRLKPGLQRCGPSRKNRFALPKRDSSARARALRPPTLPPGGRGAR